MQQTEFSEDGKYFAYMVCEKGSDWGKIKVRSVETNEDLEDVCENVKFTCLSWTHDNKGFFYNQYPSSIKADGKTTEKNEYQQLLYHRIGTKQSEDILVAKFPDEPNWMGFVFFLQTVLFVFRVSVFNRNNTFCEICIGMLRSLIVAITWFWPLVSHVNR